MFEYSLGCSPKRRDEPRDLLRGPTTILIAGNRIQFSRTEGKGFPSERVAVCSLTRLCCQRLCETFFPLSRLFILWRRAFAGRRRPGGSESGGGVCPPSFPSARSFVGISSSLSFLGISVGSGPSGLYFCTVIGHHGCGYAPIRRGRIGCLGTRDWPSSH